MQSFTIHLGLLVLFLTLGLEVEASSLPSFAADGPDASYHASSLIANNLWWTRVGDRVYHAPENGSMLSSDIGNYYYAIGSEAGVPEVLRQHRVGGEGRWHIFHVPAASASLLQTTFNTIDRRASMSRLRKLDNGTVLKKRFPDYTLHKPDYKNPLNRYGKLLEKKAVSMVTADTYSKYLKNVTSLTSRSCSQAEATANAIKLLETEFKHAGFDVCMHSFGKDNLKNVVAFQRGKGLGSIVVGAHYDSIPYSGPAPGAEDNGSGVAGLLSMAKAFKDAMLKPLRNVYFVGFAAEEKGLIGSDAFADAVKTGKGLPDECKVLGNSLMEITSVEDKKDEVHGAIIMDEIGWVSTNKELFPRQTINLEAFNTNHDMMDHMFSACRDHQCGLDVVHSDNPFGSDHMSFSNRHIPAVLTINGDDESYPNYHKATDTFENVNSEYGSKIAKMNMGALVRMVGVDEPSFLQKWRM